MSFKSAIRLFALTLTMAAGIGAAAAADDPQKPEPPPTPDRGTTSQLNCIDQNSEYTGTGKRVFFVQAFQNKCESRMKCAVFVYALNAKGPTQGHTTVVLGPKSSGAAAKYSYALRVKGAGGFTTASRECRAL
jgi:hypothetical protein